MINLHLTTLNAKAVKVQVYGYVARTKILSLAITKTEDLLFHVGTINLNATLAVLSVDCNQSAVQAKSIKSFSWVFFQIWSYIKQFLDNSKQIKCLLHTPRHTQAQRAFNSTARICVMITLYTYWAIRQKIRAHMACQPKAQMRAFNFAQIMCLYAARPS